MTETGTRAVALKLVIANAMVPEVIKFLYAPGTRVSDRSASEGEDERTLLVCRSDLSAASEILHTVSDLVVTASITPWVEKAPQTHHIINPNLGKPSHLPPKMKVANAPAGKGAQPLAAALLKTYPVGKTFRASDVLDDLEAAGKPVSAPKSMGVALWHIMNRGVIERVGPGLYRKKG